MEVATIVEVDMVDTEEDVTIEAAVIEDVLAATDETEATEETEDIEETKEEMIVVMIATLIVDANFLRPEKRTLRLVLFNANFSRLL